MQVVYKDKIWDTDVPQESFDVLKLQKPAMEIMIRDLSVEGKHQKRVQISEVEDYFYYRNINKKPSN